MAVYRKHSDVYWMDFRINGKRIHKSTGRTDEVEAKAMEFLEKEKQQHPQLSTITLEQAIDRVYDERWSNNKSGKETYQKAQLLLKYYDDVALASITATDILEMKKRMVKEGLQPGTINQHLTRLRTVFTTAMTWEAISKVPQMPKITKVEGRMRFITKDEEAVVLDTLASIDEWDVADLVAILLDTGMRLSEALNTHIEDCDTEHQMIHVWKTKTKNPRSVPMTRRVRAILTRRNPKDKVFEIDITKVEHVWQRLRTILEINDKEFVIHSLRHTFASRLAQAGYDLYKISILLGHSSIMMTQKYAHLIPENVQGAAVILNGLEAPVVEDLQGLFPTTDNAIIRRVYRT